MSQNYVAASDGGSPVQCCAKRGGTTLAIADLSST